VTLVPPTLPLPSAGTVRPRGKTRNHWDAQRWQHRRHPDHLQPALLPQNRRDPIHGGGATILLPSKIRARRQACWQNSVAQMMSCQVDCKRDIVVCRLHVPMLPRSLQAEAWDGEWCACGEGCMCEQPESPGCGCQAGGDRTCNPGAAWQVDACTVSYCAAGAAGSPWIVLVLILGSFCVLCGIGAYKLKTGALGDLGGPGGPPGMDQQDEYGQYGSRVTKVEQIQDENPSASDADADNTEEE
jgi:hypothetical protein